MRAPLRVRGPIVVGLSIFVPFTLATLANVPLAGRHSDRHIPPLVFLTIILLRSFCIGIRIDDSVIMTTWFWRYTIQLDNIVKFGSTAYVGQLNRYSEWRLDPLYRFTSMPYLIEKGGTIRRFPAIIGSRRHVEKLILAAQAELDARTAGRTGEGSSATLTRLGVWDSRKV